MSEHIEIDIRATWSDGWWAIESPQLPGLHTQARTKAEIPDAVADAAEALGYDDITMSVEYTNMPPLPPGAFDSYYEMKADERFGADIADATRKFADDPEDLARIRRMLLRMFNATDEILSDY